MDDNPLDNYNPFTDPVPRYETLVTNQNNTNNQSSESTGNGAPQKTSPPFARDSTAFHSNLLTNDALLTLERKQAELEARAAELDRREKEQQARMTSRQTSPDFEVDIPFDCRWMARMGYYLWLAYALVLLLNMGGTLGYFMVASGMSEGPLFGASILLFLIMPPISFFCWHRPLYKAFRSNSSANYLLFFVMFAIQIVITLIQCLGIDYLGSCGWLNAIRTVSVNSSVAVLMFFVAILFTGLAGASTFLLFKVHRHYRRSDVSLRQAKLEITNAAAYEASGFGAMP